MATEILVIIIKIRKKVVEIVYLLSKRDANFKERLFTALRESTVSAATYQNSFKLIEYLINLTNNDDDFDERVTTLFEAHVISTTTSGDPNNNIDYLLALFECLSTFLTSRSTNNSPPDTRLFGIVQKLIDDCVLSNSNYSNDRLIIKLSLLLKSFVLRYLVSRISGIDSISINDRFVCMCVKDSKRPR